MRSLHGGLRGIPSLGKVDAPPTSARSRRATVGEQAAERKSRPSRQRVIAAGPCLTSWPGGRCPRNALSVRNPHSTDRGRRSNIEPILRVEDGMAVAKRELGRTGLQVTTLGYGAMELRGAPRARDITEAQAETILNKALDAGINYIDTSIDYGLSEERIGRYISHRRAEYYLASKCGCLVGAPPTPRGQRGQHVFTRDNVVAGVEQSLARMKTDYLDVVQFHSSPSRQTLEEHGALEALLELRDAGKVRFVGMSGTLPHLTEHITMGVFEVFQIPYSAVEREHET